jgi:DEAD/DEAH box helicase domain-containing protein
MATVIDLLRHLGERAAPDGENALAGPVTLPAVSDSPLSLPLPPTIVGAWSRLVGRKTLGHHALALSAAQTQHSVALMGHGASPHDDLLLLILSQLQRIPQPALLTIVQEHETAFRQQLIALADTLGLRWLDAAQPGGRVVQSQMIIATPSDLHRRVLRYHDRAWRWLWPQLRCIALPELHRYTGAEAGHLHWLLRRVERLADHAPLQILTSLASVAEVGATLARLLDRQMQVVAAPDGPNHSTLIALWRCGRDRQSALLHLAAQLNQRRLAISLFGRDEAETDRLRAQAAELKIAQPEEARVALVAGVPPSIDDRQRLLRSGYRLLILLAGDEPHELLFASQPELLLNALPYWPLATHNPYVVAPQLTCAAVERPLEEAEIDRWAVRDLRDRLIKKQVLQPLPSGDLWQVDPDIDEPYSELDPRAIGGEPIRVLSPQGELVAMLPPALHDRCALPKQVFAPGLQVASSDERSLTVRLAPDPAERLTIILAAMSVRVREELAARTIRFGKQTGDLLKGKVWASQRITGLRELRPDTAPRLLPANTAETEWLAAACWLTLPAPLPEPQTIGWSLAQALPLVALARPAALLFAYDAEQQRLYLIEAEPGGVGLIDCVYNQFETLIELALQLAQSCIARSLYRSLAVAELSWINALYGHTTPPIQTALSVEQPKPVQAQPAVVPAEVAVPMPAPKAQPTIAPAPARRPALPAPSVEQTAPTPAQRPALPIRPATHQPGNGERAPLPDYVRADQRASQPTKEAAPQVATQQSAQQRAARYEAAKPTTSDEATALPSSPQPEIATDARARRYETPAPPPEPIAQHVASPAVIDETPAADQQEREPAPQPVLEPETVEAAPQPVSEPETVEAAPQEVLVTAAPERKSSIVDRLALNEEIAETPPAVDQPAHEEQPAATTTSTQSQSQPPEPEPAETSAPERPSGESLPRRRISAQYSIEDLLPPVDDEEDTGAFAEEQETPPLEEPGAASRNGHAAAPRQQSRPETPITPGEAIERDEQPAEQSAQRYPIRREPAPQRPLPQPRRTDRRNEPQRPFSHRSPSRQNPAPPTPRHEPPSTPRREPPAQRPEQARYPLRNAQNQPPNQARRDNPANKRRDQLEPRPQRPAEPPQRPPTRPQTERPEPAAPEPETDVNAMIARMRRMREEREAAQRQSAPRTERPAPAEPVELRFHIGERVQCLPYGIGVVRASRIVGGREQVLIDFPEYGEIEVDPALNLIRQLGPTANSDSPASDDA